MLKKCFRISLREHFFILVFETKQVMSRILQTGSMLLLGFLILANTPSVTAQSSREDLTTYVDPLIGTAHCRWFHFAPGSLPFGMAKPGPSTNGHYGNPSGWEAVGYDYRHGSLEGFPNFHEFQIGGVVFAPLTVELITVPGTFKGP